MSDHFGVIVRCARQLFTAIALAAVVFLVSPVQAVDYFWNSSAGGPFIAPPIWLPFNPPNFSGPGGANDTVHFNLGVSAANLYTVTGVQGLNLALMVDDDSVKLSIPASYSVNALFQTALGVDSSPGNTSVLILAGGGTGILHTTDSSIGSSSGSTAFATVDNLQWITTAGFMFVGDSGTGQLTVQNNASVSVVTGFIGDQSSATGTLNVTGIGSSWTCTTNLNVGFFGDGTVNVQSGGSVVAPHGFIGARAGSSGIVNVSGVGSSWTSVFDLEVGDLAAGALNITAGGKVTDGTALVGSVSGSVGTATISDPGSTWNTTSLAVGLFGSTGTVNIRNQSAVSVSTSTGVGAGGILNLDGGSLTTATLVNSGGGLFHWSAGTLHITGNSGLEIGSPNFFGSVFLTGPGQTLQVDHALTIDAGATFFASGSLTTGSVAIVSGGQLFSGTSAPKFGTGLVNHGDLVFTAPATVSGPITNAADGRITTLAAVTFNDLVHGAGNFFGAGTVTFAGGFSPGNSPAVVSFEGGIALADTDSLVIELAGTTAGQFDQLQIAGNLDLAGTINITLLNGFQLQPDEQFLIADVAGALTGQFTGAGQDALLGNFSGMNLFISYTAGTGNDVVLYTVPEPATFSLLPAACLFLVARRSRRLPMPQNPRSSR